MLKRIIFKGSRRNRCMHGKCVGVRAEGALCEPRFEPKSRHVCVKSVPRFRLKLRPECSVSQCLRRTPRHMYLKRVPIIELNSRHACSNANRGLNRTRGNQCACLCFIYINTNAVVVAKPLPRKRWLCQRNHIPLQDTSPTLSTRTSSSNIQHSSFSSTIIFALSAFRTESAAFFWRACKS